MGKIKILIYIVFCFLFVLTGTTLCFASAVDAANAGMKAYKAGDKKKAKILFKSALKSNELSKENYIIVNNQLAEVLRSELRNSEAIECYSETLYLNPDNPVARLRRGTLYYQIGRYEDAVKDLNRYTSLAPGDHNGYINRGLAFRALKNYDRAISDLDHVVWLRPGNQKAYIHRGNTYFEAGNYNLALADFEKAIKIDPENSYAYQAMAWLYAACPNNDFRDGEKAVELAEKALALEKSDTPNPIFQATLAAAYAQSGMYRKAVDAQQQAMVLENRSRADFNVSKKELYRRLKLYERGESYSTE